MKKNTTKSGAVIIEAMTAIAIIIGVVFVAYKLLNMSCQLDEQVVSGIVYDASFDNWPSNNTYFKVRASVEMAVTEQTSRTFCLPPDSEYIDIIREAAEDKSIKVVVRVKKTKPHQRSSFLACDDNTEVKIKGGRMKPQAQIEYKPLSELKELPGNPRTISKAQFEKLKKSLQDNADYFEARPIILSDRTGELVILAGNQRYKAAKALKMEQVPTIALHGLTEEREREIIIRDNVNNGEWNVDMLANEWNPDELIEWGVEIPDIKAEIEIIEDEAPELDESRPAKSKLGEIYQLGDHRLMVGDSTKAEQVAELMAGEQADLLVTDPPYNVNYANIKASVMKALHHRTDGKTISNDNFKDDSEFQQFLIDSLGNANDALKDGGVFYIWHAGSQAFSFWEATHQIGWTVREILNWVKDRLSMGRQDYQWQHEPCLYGWKGGAGHYFIDLRTLTTVFDDEKPLDELSNKELKELVANYRQAVPTTIIREPKPSKSEEHPTMKPVKLIARLIGNSSREGELVLDIFGGSGTTMIAAEQLNRRCYMMELDPHYADVIIERWEKFTGQKAVRIKEAA